MGSLPLSPSLYLDSFPGDVLRLPRKATPENPLLKGSVQCPLLGARVRVCLCVRLCACLRSCRWEWRTLRFETSPFRAVTAANPSSVNSTPLNCRPDRVSCLSVTRSVPTASCESVQCVGASEGHIPRRQIPSLLLLVY